MTKKMKELESPLNGFVKCEIITEEDGIEYTNIGFYTTYGEDFSKELKLRRNHNQMPVMKKDISIFKMQSLVSAHYLMLKQIPLEIFTIKREDFINSAMRYFLRIINEAKSMIKLDNIEEEIKKEFEELQSIIRIKDLEIKEAKSVEKKKLEMLKDYRDSFEKLKNSTTDERNK